MPSDANTNRIAGLEALLKDAPGKGPAPVEKWNPPYCGDIGMKISSDGVWIYGGSPSDACRSSSCSPACCARMTTGSTTS